MENSAKQKNFRTALTSMVCIMVAMGLGRFALTPQMPHMIFEGQVNLTQASLLAAANFLGYLIGAIESVYAKHHQLILRLKSGLWGSVILLLLSAFINSNLGSFYLNISLRFLAGIASAWVLVLISTWLQKELSRDHGLRTLSFTGVGVGITMTGLLALVLDIYHRDAAFNWLVFGIVAAVLTAFIFKNLPASMPVMPQDKHLDLKANEYCLIISYGFCGMGYVLPATFLSKLAVDQFPGSLLADAFWPLFGLAVIIGMTLLGLPKDIKNPKRLLAVIYLIQALGILACTFFQGLGGLLIGTFMVGGSFMVILQLTMRIGAELAPNHLRAMTGVLTTAFAIGQLIGPLLSALSTHFTNSMTLALLAAAAGSLLAVFLTLSIKK